MTGEAFWISIFLFFIFPWVVIRFLLKEKLASFGLSLGNRKRGIIYSVIFVAVFVLINYFIIKTPSLRNQLQISPDIVRSFWVFLWFQLFVSLSSHFSMEFFFRGFVQFGLEEKIGKWVILAQAAVQTLLYSNSPWIIILLVGLSSLGAGYIAMKSRSVYYSFVAMWLISLSLDIMIIRYIFQGIT
ncbi:MAG: hypothetical protein PHU88_12200 [candidate division Zixibacteria bacterium]|nr:hypothetical protein [candidate division Zixibacteria bacterium]